MKALNTTTPRPELFASVTSSDTEGLLDVNVTSEVNNRPIDGAQVQITRDSDPEQIIEQTTTNSLGQIPELTLPAPPVDYSMEPGANKPYAEYTITITAPGFEPFRVSGAEIFSGETAIQNASLLPASPTISGDTELYVIPDHTLWGDYPPKIAENEIKSIDETGEIVLSRVVIPEYIVVHNGPPSDRSAKDYYVPYRDYIKNVASSEIYSTWPEATLQANILAIQSFTLNRVFTEWYRNKGYDFTITSSTAYDHKWIPNRNVFESISNVVDEIFSNYLSRPGVLQPILTQYCDGRRVQCRDRGWMTQWGSKSLGDQGYSAIEIIRSFYGNDMYINVAEAVSGIPVSWPGYDLTIGVTGEKVQQIQEQLNAIAKAYPAIPTVTVDGIYGPATAASVKKFQNVFGLPASGVVDYPTWYKIQEIYVAVTRIAELR